MAYKDILVYLDPTVETVERTRLAVSLAKAHGARLIEAPTSARLPRAKRLETGAEVNRTFSDTTRTSGPTTRFVPAGQAGRIRAVSPIAST